MAELLKSKSTGGFHHGDGSPCMKYVQPYCSNPLADYERQKKYRLCMSCFISRCKSSQSQRGFTPIILLCGILSSLSLSLSLQLCPIHSFLTDGGGGGGGDGEEGVCGERSFADPPPVSMRGRRRRKTKRATGPEGRENVSLRPLKCIEIQDILL